MDQMDLAQIGLAGVTRHPGAVLDGLAQMRVAFDTEACHEPDTGDVGFSAMCASRYGKLRQPPLASNLVSYCGSLSANGPLNRSRLDQSQTWSKSQAPTPWRIRKPRHA